MAQVVAFWVWVEVIGLNQITQVGAAHCIIAGKIKIGDVEAIRRNHISIIRNADRCPVMAADAFEVPDFIFVGKGNSVTFIGAVLLEQTA